LGLIGRKLGMAQIYTAQGELMPVTVIQAGPCTVIQTKTRATDGYAAVQLGFGDKKPQRATRAYRNHCLKAGKGVFEVLREFRLEAEDENLALGREVFVQELFKEGERVAKVLKKEVEGVLQQGEGINIEYISLCDTDTLEEIEAINKTGTTILLIEQNARRALTIADRGYVIELGQIRYEGKGGDLLEDEQVKRAYLGAGEAGE